NLLAIFFQWMRRSKFGISRESTNRENQQTSSFEYSQKVKLLFALEAFEVGHLVGHFFTGGVGCGTNTLNLEAEFVGVRSAEQGFFDGDELFVVEIEERLIEGLHAVLRSAGGDGVVNEASFIGVDDAIADVGGGDHNFDGGDAAF